MLSFDTDILVYAADRSAGERHQLAVKLIAAAHSVESALIEQTLFEFLHVVTRKKKQATAEAEHLIRAWRNNFSLIQAPATIVEDTLALLQSFPLSVWDARMLAVANSWRCDILFSEDLSDRVSYGYVQVLNPFDSRNAGLLAELLEI